MGRQLHLLISRFLFVILFFALHTTTKWEFFCRLASRKPRIHYMIQLQGYGEYETNINIHITKKKLCIIFVKRHSHYELLINT